MFNRDLVPTFTPTLVIRSNRPQIEMRRIFRRFDEKKVNIDRAVLIKIFVYYRKSDALNTLALSMAATLRYGHYVISVVLQHRTWFRCYRLRFFRLDM